MASLAFPSSSTIILLILTSILAKALAEKSTESSIDFQMTSDRMLENNNLYLCKNGFYCRLMCSEGVPFTMVLEKNSYFTVALLLSNKKQDLTVQYDSNFTSSQIETKLLLSHADATQTSMEVPDGTSWSLVVSGPLIKSYSDGVLILEVDNQDEEETATITFRMDFSIQSQNSFILNFKKEKEGIVVKVVVPVVSVTLFILIVIAICYYRKKRQQRQRLAARDNNQLDASNGQQQSQIGDESCLTMINMGERFPEKKRENITSSFPQSVCSICLEDVPKGAVCRQLDCEHIFHSECIQLWLSNQLKKGNASCPNCNHSMMNNSLGRDQDNIIIQF